DAVLKIFDDREQEWEVMEDHYRSPIPERLRWRNWAADAAGITGEKLLDFVNNDLFKTLKELSLNGAANGRGYVVRSVFEDAYNYMKNGTLIRQVINKLNEGVWPSRPTMWRRSVRSGTKSCTRYCGRRLPTVKRFGTSSPRSISRPTAPRRPPWSCWRTGPGGFGAWWRTSARTPYRFSTSVMPSSICGKQAN